MPLSLITEHHLTVIAIINTRGTGEAQGPSAGFRTMNSRITSQVSGGKIVSEGLHALDEMLTSYSTTLYIQLARIRTRLPVPQTYVLLYRTSGCR